MSTASKKKKKMRGEKNAREKKTATNTTISPSAAPLHSHDTPATLPGQLSRMALNKSSGKCGSQSSQFAAGPTIGPGLGPGPIQRCCRRLTICSLSMPGQGPAQPDAEVARTIHKITQQLRSTKGSRKCVPCVCMSN